jgi:2-phospho-L-lactate/phosphoenolpyruvate guanylyltransferase
MKYLLIPVKDLRNAKQRLAGVMSRGERCEFAGLMLEHTFAEVAKARGCHRVAVVTLYEPGAELARRLGFDVIREKEQVSESISVDYALTVLTARGAASALRLPIDLPLLSADDIETILAAMDLPGGRPAVVLVPSRAGTGTNAIGRMPPDLFPSHFGPGSFDMHREEARRCGAVCRELRLPGVEGDLDDPGDLAWFLKHGRGTRLHEFLTDLAIGDRMTGFTG